MERPAGPGRLRRARSTARRNAVGGRYPLPAEPHPSLRYVTQACYVRAGRPYWNSTPAMTAKTANCQAPTRRSALPPLPQQAGTAEALDAWPAPHVTAPVEATVRVPGSKSATNRALVLAALAGEPSRLREPLRSRDTLLMAEGLRRCGVSVDDDGDDWLISPASGAVRSGVATDGAPRTIDCGNAGTVARFLPPAAGVLSREQLRFDGDERMRERPLGPLLQALRALGATVDDSGRSAMPFTLRAPDGMRGGEVTLDASSSSQLVSGLLLSTPSFANGVVVRHSGEPVPSAPHLRMTVAMLRESGAVVDDGTPDVWTVSPGRLRGLDRAIEPDLSSASAFLAAAAATGGEVTLEGWPAATEQPGRLLPQLLEEFGCSCRFEDGRLEVGGPQRLQGVDLDLHEYGEATPTLCALTLLADGPSRLRGVAHLRLQETDRLAALAEEFGRLGADIAVTDDGLAIRPAPLSGGTLDPRSDHRPAMADAGGGPVGAGGRGVDVGTTGKTVPGL